MSIENRRQWENTRAKLKELEQFYEKRQHEPADIHIRELTLRSLRKRINQFKEEIARYESRAKTSAAKN